MVVKSLMAFRARVGGSKEAVDESESEVRMGMGVGNGGAELC